jgi:hypothetical protein
VVTDHVFRHEALLHRDRTQYFDAVVPFLREGVDCGDQVLVAGDEREERELRDRLGGAADRMTFVDVYAPTVNPARLMPVLTGLLEQRRPDDRPLRLLGRPLTSGCRAVEAAESRLLEGLINLVIPPDAPLWLLCPYDAGTGDPEVTAHAEHSHPVLLDDGRYRGSTSYSGAWYVEETFRRPLPPAPADAEVHSFGRAETGEVANRVLAAAFRAGLSAARSHRLAAAMRELATDATVADVAVLRVWCNDDAVVCEIEDPVVSAPLVGRLPVTTRAARKGLWQANQTSDLIQVRSTDAGTTVRVHTWR